MKRMKKVGDKQNEPLTYLTFKIAPIKTLANGKLQEELAKLFICTVVVSIS